MPSRIDPALIPDSPNLQIEQALWDAGIRRIAGIDEAGRGALAGPVAASAVILPPRRSVERELEEVRDSKEMTPAQRESWSRRIREIAWAWGVGFASPAEIDALRIVPATRLAAQRALANLSVSPEHLLLDYLFLNDIPQPQTSLIKGDMRSLSIAAASVLAKTSRDALLVELGDKYPGYGFAGNKGYGTRSHREAIERLGPSRLHRFSFAPMRSIAD
ncbi:MAG: ribonuclease HII [Chloroflexota bacterium]|nr:ribonuclease HII [Chloroflexota bacterium]